MSLYRFESDQSIFVNLDTPDTELLLERKEALEQKIAALTTDLTVITEAITKEKP